MSSAVPAPKITDYQGNSKLDREIAAEETPVQEEPRLKKLEGVTVVKTKKSLGKRIKEGLGGGSDMQSVGSYLLWDVAVPAARDLIFDIIIEGARGSLYGEARGRSRGSSGPISNIVGSNNNSRIRTTNYNGVSQSPIIGQQQGVRSAGNVGASTGQFDFSDLKVDSRGQAEHIIQSMRDAIQQYGLVSVAEFYNLIGQSGNGFTDQKHGWNMETFEGARARAHRGGFVLEIPQPSPFE